MDETKIQLLGGWAPSGWFSRITPMISGMEFCPYGGPTSSRKRKRSPWAYCNHLRYITGMILQVPFIPLSVLLVVGPAWFKFWWVRKILPSKWLDFFLAWFFVFFHFRWTYQLGYCPKPPHQKRLRCFKCRLHDERKDWRWVPKKRSNSF